jgi:predicted secreted protein
MWVWLLAAVVAVGVAAPAARRWWSRRAWADPSRDPGAARVTPAIRDAVERLVTADAPPQRAVEQGLLLCEVEDLRWWRAGLRRVLPLADRLDGSPDADALRAELALALGELARARALCGRLPADHWRGCVVRAGLYAIDGDEERSDSALVAAAQLAPADRRDPIYRRLEARRRRRGAHVGPHLALWERPPEP